MIDNITIRHTPRCWLITYTINGELNYMEVEHGTYNDSQIKDFITLMLQEDN